MPPSLERVYYLGVALGREGIRARLAYVGALLRLRDAWTAWGECGVVVDPLLPGHMDVWTPEQTETMRRAGEAFVEMVTAKISYDNVLRAPQQPPH